MVYRAGLGLLGVPDTIWLAGGHSFIIAPLMTKVALKSSYWSGLIVQMQLDLGVAFR